MIFWDRDCNKKVVRKKKVVGYSQKQKHQGAGSFGKILPKRTDVRTRSLKSLDNMDSSV